MIEPHLHCAQCGLPIALFVADADGTPQPVKVRAGQQPFVVPAPEGFAVTMREVPICGGCHEKITAAAAASKLVVPNRPPLAVV